MEYFYNMIPIKSDLNLKNWNAGFDFNFDV